MKSNLDLVSFLFCCNLLSFSFFFQFLALVLIFLFSFILLCISYFLIPHHNGLTNILRFYPRFSCSNILCLYFLLFASTLSYFVLFSFKINFVLYLMADALKASLFPSSSPSLSISFVLALFSLILAQSSPLFILNFDYFMFQSLDLSVVTVPINSLKVCRFLWSPLNSGNFPIVLLTFLIPYY